MMLWTLALLPATCLAIEPQKFSAATTRMPVVLADEMPPQPARRTPMTRAAAEAAMTRLHMTSTP